jgi:hypothetical protein
MRAYLPIKSGYKIVRRGNSKIRNTVKNLWAVIKNETLDSAFSLSEEEFIAYFNIDNVSRHLVRGNMSAAKDALFKHYHHCVNGKWLLPANIITDLRLKVSELNSEEIIARANQILDFRLFGDDFLPLITADGGIDWAFNPMTSPQWLWRLHRHQWWLVLGLAYKESGNENYACAFVDQMLDWIANHPLPAMKNEKSYSWRLMETGMRLSVSWIRCFALFYHSLNFTNEAKLTMLRSIYDHAQFLFRFKTNRNHLLRESNGLAYAGTYFSEFRDAALWRKEAFTRIDKEIQNQINLDGTQIEASVGYQWLVVDELQQTYDLLKTNNYSLPSQNLGPVLEKMYRVLAYLIRPDGSFPEINDGFIRWGYERLEEAGDKFDQDYLTFVGTAGKKGTAPKFTSMQFENAGFYIMRSDWSKDARYLLFVAGPYGGPHGHEDKLSVEVAAFGQTFIVDSGSYTYEKADPYREYFVGSQSHNTVLVDRYSQIRRWQKAHMHPKTGSISDAVWISKTGFDYAEASYFEGYSSFRLRKPENFEMIDDVCHTRRVIFVKPDYWIIIDTLKAEKPHAYQLLFHVKPDIEVSEGSDLSVLLCGVSSKAGLHIIPTKPADLMLHLACGTESPIQGWFSRDHHYKVPSTAVIYDSKEMLSAEFVTLLYPVAKATSKMDLSIQALQVSGEQNLAYSVDTPQGIDYIMCSADRTLKQYGSFESNAILAVSRTDHKGKLISHDEGSGIGT